jgi:hypothetical protein
MDSSHSCCSCLPSPSVRQPPPAEPTWRKDPEASIASAPPSRHPSLQATITFRVHRFTVLRIRLLEVRRLHATKNKNKRYQRSRVAIRHLVIVGERSARSSPYCYHFTLRRGGQPYRSSSAETGAARIRVLIPLCRGGFSTTRPPSSNALINVHRLSVFKE